MAKAKQKSNAFDAAHPTPDSLDKAIDAYFEQVSVSDTVPSEAGLALFLKVSVITLRRWYDGDTRPELQDVVQAAYATMTADYMQLLLTGNKNMTPFVIFMLKQPRFAAYQDKVEAKQDIAVNVKMGASVDESDFK